MADNLNIIETFYGVIIKTTKDRQVMLLILDSIGKHLYVKPKYDLY